MRSPQVGGGGDVSAGTRKQELESLIPFMVDRLAILDFKFEILAEILADLPNDKVDALSVKHPQELGFDTELGRRYSATREALLEVLRVELR